MGGGSWEQEQIDWGTHHSRDVFMVLFVRVAFLHPDGCQSFQDRGAEVKQGSNTVIGCVLQGQEGSSESWAAATLLVPSRQGSGPAHPHSCPIRRHHSPAPSAQSWFYLTGLGVRGRT